MALRADYSMSSDPVGSRLARYQTVRAQTVALIDGLTDADCTVQSMDDASPAKWHLAHTSWFWEEFLIAPLRPNQARFHPRFQYLFNSYYEAVGNRHERAQRGLLTRPDLNTVLAYRHHVDAIMQDIFACDELSSDQLALIDLGLAHEEQHQELLLTDILHLFSRNPLKPAFRPPLDASPESVKASSLQWTEFPEAGLTSLGHDGDGFAFDCEQPAHQTLLRPFALANRAVTNAEWIRFIEDGGYQTPSLWLSDGWARIHSDNWTAPLYWRQQDGGWHSMTLFGEQRLALSAPVCHISFYEADAFASWAAAQGGVYEGARLPLEAEWEFAARDSTEDETEIDTLTFRPRPQSGDTLNGLFGDVWEWTASPFSPYPGFSAASGAVGEYNGKFMSGQYVLRGGSCATPNQHIRTTYRNFFQPEKRWQFSGLRLAKTL